jgi:hypothetical protein
MTNFSCALMRSRPRTISQRVVPANAGTYHPWPQKVRKGLGSSVETRVRAVWVPAFAGTTR